MRPFAPLRRFARVWDYLLGNAPVVKPRNRLGVEALERRDVPATLEGYVFYDLNGDSLYDPGEPGLEGVEVKVNGEGYGYAVTGPDGWYQTDDFGDGLGRVPRPGR